MTTRLIYIAITAITICAPGGFIIGPVLYKLYRSYIAASAAT